MLTFSVLWVVLSAAVSVLAMARRSANDRPSGIQTQAKESGDALEFVAIVSCIVLLAGFVYVGRFLVAGL